MKSFRIEICGGIASGKTTLANLLAGPDTKLVLENFQTNPFWQAFYADPVGTAFETEVSFLLQHYHEVKTSKNPNHKLVCDFSMYLDLAYAHVTLDQDKLEAFLASYREVEKELTAPSLLIHLRCDPEIELERIRNRGREVEKSITIGYLQQINKWLEQVLIERAFPGDQLVIDSGMLDFVHDEDMKQAILDQVSIKISSGTQFL